MSSRKTEKENSNTMQLHAFIAANGGISQTPAPVDVIEGLPIADFHAKEVKALKAIHGVYYPTVLGDEEISELGPLVRDFYRNNIGMGYRAGVVTQTLLKVAEAQGVNAATLQHLKRCQYWVDIVLHEGGGLSGFTPLWTMFWKVLNASTSSKRYVVYSEDARVAEKLVIKQAKACGTKPPVETFGTVVYSSKKAYLSRVEADFPDAKDLKVFQELEALVWFGTEIVGESRPSHDWELLRRARMLTVLMGQLEAQKDVELEAADKALPNADLEMFGCTYEELALVAGVFSRGSKGINGQEWNKAALVAEGSRGNFAMRLSDDVIRKAFPRHCLARDILFSLANLHRRLGRFSQAVKAREDDEAFDGLG
jgi:hypothetical protein